MSEQSTPSDVQRAVKDKYRDAALRVSTNTAACSSSGCRSTDPISSNLYDELQKSEIPDTALLASLGCGNPTALAKLQPGETVLDLGSGGGIDVLLAAKCIGPRGKAYGLDMTEEMLALARENQKKAGISNAEFLKGNIERIPLPDSSVDVIISNCVINLSTEKDRVLREAFRVLKPRGRLAVSDVVVLGSVPDQIRENMLLWIGCIAGALEIDDYHQLLTAAGFEDIQIQVTRTYRSEDARAYLMDKGLESSAISDVDGKFASAFIEARRPFNAGTSTQAD